MIYTFTENLYRQGNRYFIRIPFNVWETCNQKGMLPVRVTVEDTVFECKLISKGAGTYFIPVSKAVVQQLNSDGELPVSFEIIRELTRINKNSPYTTDHPVSHTGGGIFETGILRANLYRYAQRSSYRRGYRLHADEAMAVFLIESDGGIALFWYIS